MTIVKHRPLRSFTPFDELVNGFFGRDLSHFIGSDDMQRSMPRVNIVESKENYKLELLAPGFRKEDLKLNVENDMLSISGEKQETALDENERFTRREFGHTSFKRSFTLPEQVDADRIKAEFVNGVLHVTIPRTEPAKPAVRAINVD